nr:transcription factor CPC-like [Tanacetum cinerariifolium]
MAGRNEDETANHPGRNTTPMQTTSFANIVKGETPTSDGLSIITSKLGTPMLLDSYVYTICEESWGRNSYARALIELHAENEFKDSLIFGHTDSQCVVNAIVPKPSIPSKNMVALNREQVDGFTVVNEVQKVNVITPIVRPVMTKQPSSSSYKAEEDSEGELEHVYDESGTYISFKSSGSGYGTKSLYERWNELRMIHMIHTMMMMMMNHLIYSVFMASTHKHSTSNDASSTSREEIFSQELKLEFSEDEKSLITRMYKLVGERWSLIAGRIPGRTADEIKEYWTSRFSTSD